MVLEKTTSCGKEKQLLNSDLYRLIIKMLILSKISKTPKIYSYKLMKDIEKLGINKIIKDKAQLKNDIYNNVSALEKIGYIKQQLGEKNIKTYTITNEGKLALKETRRLLKTTEKELQKLF
ncbi:MAG: hypothetical protein ACP5RP_03460 [Candidatus Micrarchaeia archaeon]